MARLGLPASPSACLARPLLRAPPPSRSRPRPQPRPPASWSVGWRVRRPSALAPPPGRASPSLSVSPLLLRLLPQPPPHRKRKPRGGTAKENRQAPRPMRGSGGSRCSDGPAANGEGGRRPGPMERRGDGVARQLAKGAGGRRFGALYRPQAASTEKIRAPRSPGGRFRHREHKLVGEAGTSFLHVLYVQEIYL